MDIYALLPIRLLTGDRIIPHPPARLPVKKLHHTVNPQQALFSFSTGILFSPIAFFYVMVWGNWRQSKSHLWMTNQFTTSVQYSQQYLNSYWMDCHKMFYTNIHVSHKMKPTDWQPTDFPLATQWGWNFWFILITMTFNTSIHGPQRMNPCYFSSSATSRLRFSLFLWITSTSTRIGPKICAFMVPRWWILMTFLRASPFVTIVGLREISQHSFKRAPWHLSQTFMFPLGWIVTRATSAIIRRRKKDCLLYVMQCRKKYL